MLRARWVWHVHGIWLTIPDICEGMLCRRHLCICCMPSSCPVSHSFYTLVSFDFDKAGFSIVVACSKGQMCGAMQQGGDAGGQAAIAELIKEATLLSSMRHPNVVWVYGIVLKPMSKDDDDDDDELSDRDQGDACSLQYPKWCVLPFLSF